MESIVENQRRIIEDVTGKPAKETPQVWALYKEVLDQKLSIKSTLKADQEDNLDAFAQQIIDAM